MSIHDILWNTIFANKIEYRINFKKIRKEMHIHDILWNTILFVIDYNKRIENPITCQRDS
jgi:hypothetical protein